MLRARFGLYDTWAFFTSIKTRKAPPPDPAPPPPAGPDDGGTGVPLIARAPVVSSLAGSVIPARKGTTIRIQRRVGGKWIEAGTTTARRGGRYRYGVTAPGVYRVRHRGDAGPAVRIP